MNHEQQDTEMLQMVSDAHHEATARFAQELGRMAASAAACALTFVNVRALHEAAHTVFESAYENALGDAERIGEEIRRAVGGDMVLLYDGFAFSVAIQDIGLSLPTPI